VSANKIGPFEILRTLGRTDEKRVFKAATPSDGIVAVRPVPRNCPNPAGLVDAARRAMTLESPNIVQVLEVAESDGEAYAVTEYVEGNSLRSLMKQDAEVSVWDATDIARQICSAIDHARLRHLEHKNFTPTNIMIEWDGAVKVMDYETLTDPRESYLTGRNPEALHYLSPEQARGAEADWRSNLFSLGAMLYELLTQQKAFPGVDAQEILENITSKEPKAPHRVRASLNPGLSRVIMKALSKAPEERYQSGRELIQDFENCRKLVTEPVAQFARLENPVANSIRKSEERAPVDSNAARQAETFAPRPVASIAVRPNQNFAATAPASLQVRSRCTGVAKPAPAPEPVFQSTQPKLAPGSPAVATMTSIAVKTQDNPVEAPVAPPMFAPQVFEGAEAEDSQKTANAARQRLRQRLKKPSLSGFAVKHKAALLYAAAGALLFIASLGLGRGIGDVIRAYGRPSQPAAPVAEQPAPQPQVMPAVEQLPVPPEETRPLRSGTRAGKKRGATVIAAASPALMTGELMIESSPPGASIQLDGGVLSFQTPYTTPSLSVGRHTVNVSKPGYAAESRTVEIIAGLQSHLVIPLAELGATVSIASDPSGAAVFVDGQDSGRTTPVALVLKKGSHTLSLRKVGYLQAAGKLDVVPGQSFQFAPHLSPTGNEDDIKAVGKFGRILGRHARGSMATLQVRSNPKGARIIVNQRVLDKTTPAEFSIPEGAYEVALALDGYSRVERTISVAGGSTFTIDEKLQK
jgi:serine/threonine protein kinase